MTVIDTAKSVVNTFKAQTLYAAVSTKDRPSEKMEETK